MFLHVGNFTKLMKAAYKNGRLDIGNFNGGLFLCSGHWVVWIEGDHVPNKIKAMVVELAGVMPQRNQLFEVRKGFPLPQGKLWDATYSNLLKGIEDADKKLIITPLELFEHNPCTILQDLMGNVFAISTTYLGMIDKTAVDFDAGESSPTGPCYRMDINQGIYWYNDFGIAIIMPHGVSDKREALIRNLGYIQFKEDGSIEEKYGSYGEFPGRCYMPEETGKPEQEAAAAGETEETDAEG